MKPEAPIVQSVFAFAIREINALEVKIVTAEDDADAMLWDQARRVVEQLDAGTTQRALAAQWINVRTGAPYSLRHVQIVRQAYVDYFNSHPRPRFRDAYNAITNATSNKVTRFVNQTGDVEWYTPPSVIDAARDVLGEIDLDPASCEIANTVVQASQIYTEADNGLGEPWTGRVFMNPPYRHPDVQRFCEKFAGHAKAGEIEGIALVNNTTDTKAFRALAAVGTAYCFPWFRLAFWKPDRDLNPAMQGQVIVYSGPDPAAFCRRFDAIGLVLIRPDNLSGSCPDTSAADRTDKPPL